MISYSAVFLIVGNIVSQQSGSATNGTDADKPEIVHATSLEERTQTFKWFSDLGFSDLKDRKFARVATGKAHHSGDGPPQNTYLSGFPLREKEGGFTVLTLSLTEETFVKTPAGTPAHEVVGCEAKDLNVAAAEYLKVLRAPIKDQGQDYRWFHGEIALHRRTETFVLAWACWRNGLDESAADLFDEAAKMPTGYGFNPYKPPTDRLQKLVADDLAHTEMWRAVVAFGEPAIARNGLLDRFEHIVKNYSESEHHGKAKAYATLLRQMIKEDDQHAKKAAKPFAKLTKNEQIAELIFQLREQNGHQFMQPGACDIFGDFFDDEDKKTTPAHRLVAFGEKAIPQLIEALEDERLTRSVEYHRNFHFSHEVMRVGDCAAQILNRITDWDFGEHRVYTGKAVGSRAKAQAWWKEFQEKGEKQMLIEATQKGDRNGVLRVDRLVKKYPEAALAAIAVGARNADDDWHRAHFIRTARRLKGADTVTFLREELNGPFQRSRLAAAEALRDLGDDAGMDAMIREWQEAWRGNPPDAYEKTSSLISFFVWSGSPKALQLLATDLRLRPLEMRLQVVQTLEGKERRPDKDKPPEVQLIVERILIDFLDDVQERRGMSSRVGKQCIYDPRICDFAAFALSERWDKQQLFNLSASPRNRDRQIIEIKNIWLKKNGKDPLPAARKVARAPEKQVIVLLDGMRAAKANDDRQAALKALESIGLPALPAMRETLGKLPTDHGARADLAALASRLAFRVAAVRFAGDETETTEEIRTRVATMRGKTLTEQDFLELCVVLLEGLPPEARGYQIDFERPGDDTGAEMVISWVHGKSKSATWRSRQQIFLANESVRHSIDSTEKLGLALTKPEKEWADFAKKLKEAFASEPGDDVSILVECAREK
jgi:hypothetical protein